VPPHVTNAVARRAPTEARVAAQMSAHMSRRQRRRRAEAVPDMATLDLAVTSSIPRAGRESVAAVLTGGKRTVYDCERGWEQRKTEKRAESAGESGDADVDMVYDYGGIVRDFFAEILGRDSIDNQGLDLILNVHYGENYQNAFWDGDEMTFGDGDGQLFTSFAKSLDVTAHELAHGVTQFTANLEYSGQSGALNESFSDTFGAAITQSYAKQTPDDADWLIGDEIMGPTLYGESLRSMKMPGTAYDNTLLGKDPQPAHMKDYYAGPQDNQGVHINSGIPNRVFYLVASDLGDSVKAARLWYATLQKLWPTAQFADFAQVLIDTARELTKDKVVPLGTTQVVRTACRDVGIV
jgi:Zn-dependent metalloprotease